MMEIAAANVFAEAYCGLSANAENWSLDAHLGYTEESFKDFIDATNALNVASGQLISASLDLLEKETGELPEPCW